MTSGFLKKQAALVPDRERNMATAKKIFRQILAKTTTSPLALMHGQSPRL